MVGGEGAGWSGVAAGAVHGQPSRGSVPPTSVGPTPHSSPPACSPPTWVMVQRLHCHLLAVQEHRLGHHGACGAGRPEPGRAGGRADTLSARCSPGASMPLQLQMQGRRMLHNWGPSAIAWPAMGRP